jgi:hypothetical protein
MTWRSDSLGGHQRVGRAGAAEIRTERILAYHYAEFPKNGIKANSVIDLTLACDRDV